MFTFFVSWLECNEIRFFNILDYVLKKKKKKKKKTSCLFQFENHNFQMLGCVRMRIEDISATGK